MPTYFSHRLRLTSSSQASTVPFYECPAGAAVLQQMDAHPLRSPSGGGFGFTGGSRSRLSVGSHRDLRTQEISQPHADQTSSYPGADLFKPVAFSFVNNTVVKTGIQRNQQS